NQILDGTHLHFQMEGHLQKEKEWYLQHKFEENLGSTSIAVHATVTTENLADVSVLSRTVTGAVMQFAAATGATLMTGCFTSGIFTNQIQTAFRANHQPLMEASHAYLPATAALSSVPCGHCHPCNKFAHSGVSGVDASPGSSALGWHCCPRNMNTHGKSCLISASMEILKTDKEERPAAEKTVVQGESQGGCGSRLAPLCPLRCFPVKLGECAQPAANAGTAAPDLYVQCISVAEPNAKQAPCCAVLVHLPPIL
ncbi:40S ribosomal protein SA, partial [Galemys pyrenaicus]